MREAEAEAGRTGAVAGREPADRLSPQELDVVTTGFTHIDQLSDD